MKMELERFRQLDEVRRQLREVWCQGDKERANFREEQERTAGLLEKLKKKQESLRQSTNRCSNYMIDDLKPTDRLV